MAKTKDHPIASAQRRLVQRSVAKVEPIAEAAEPFYNKLFELDPGLSALFKTDITGPQADGDPHLTLIGRRQ